MTLNNACDDGLCLNFALFQNLHENNSSASIVLNANAFPYEKPTVLKTEVSSVKYLHPNARKIHVNVCENKYTSCDNTSISTGVQATKASQKPSDATCVKDKSFNSVKTFKTHNKIFFTWGISGHIARTCNKSNVQSHHPLSDQKIKFPKDKKVKMGLDLSVSEKNSKPLSKSSKIE